MYVAGGGIGPHLTQLWMPSTTLDAIVETAAVIQGLQTIVSRNLDPLETGVVTCGTVNGGYGYNIIADHVEITGT